MKYFIFLLFAGLTLCTSCKQNGNTATSQASNYISTNAKDKTQAKVVPASVLAPLIATWEVQVTVGISNKERRNLYDGRWYTLRGDQTFTCGVFDKETNQGSYQFDGDTELIDFFYDSPEVGVANQFKIKGIGNNDSSVLIWLGNTPNNPAGMQLKMIKSDNPQVQ